MRLNLDLTTVPALDHNTVLKTTLMLKLLDLKNLSLLGLLRRPAKGLIDEFPTKATNLLLPVILKDLHLTDRASLVLEKLMDRAGLVLRTLTDRAGLALKTLTDRAGLVLETLTDRAGLALKTLTDRARLALETLTDRARLTLDMIAALVTTA